MNKLLTTILLWASASCALAYTHKKIDVKAGLSNNLVLCLTTDNEGDDLKHTGLWAGSVLTVPARSVMTLKQKND